MGGGLARQVITRVIDQDLAIVPDDELVFMVKPKVGSDQVLMKLLTSLLSSRSLPSSRTVLPSHPLVLPVSVSETLQPRRSKSTSNRT